ncbi:DUF4426 domain-containing protein [Paraglaciecola chathamensis]|jgi:hypothetical protein|uniref:DUF4426 domain-containing protein n=2 Tax=Paraglaciecola chathamensis TaxID=368405 RepID=A0A8H9IBP8_9ALTE|nr:MULTISPECIES: DUF4426 domain-containing protein [Paraglaciecola]AEE24641.1 hypothetical protein Glaag_3712 [Glaciecola sp. 4H-3-7+YE-5]MBN26040.1 DUF4426 domain-containing protein [Alteromonadaceae bacterium]GAC08656.1 hypothetical protein GCHA_0693 [Paraglaciecola chathamensis S18K6]GGZ49411.1 hypothetical protein GCM10011274_04310 [Paraglaciecola oceanifecundans]|tara:strand:- start:55591 stop:56040 length:450 start_codon:yes stop_codon:yes gene_type:complete
MSLVISKRSLMAGSLMLLANLLFSAMAVAEQKETLGKWDVHYIAFNSTFITPDIAKHYSIVRSKYNGVINISVLNKADQKAQSAVLTGTARNLLGVSKSLTFKEVSEGDAIYYIAVLPFSDQETFRITVNINDGTDQQVLKFQHKFYAE